MAAKKQSKKMSKKPGSAGGKKHLAKKSASRPSQKSAPVKKSGPVKPARNTLDPAPVSTGRGPSPLEVGQSLVSMFNQGKFTEIEEMWWNPREIESIEGHGTAMSWKGKQAVQAKGEWWMSEHVLHGASAEGPYVGASGFAVKYRMDVETKASGKRELMEEVGVYTVRDGKIVREEFMYLIPTQG